MIKKRIFTIIFLIACWTTYSDLTSGSLPAGAVDNGSAQPAAAEHAAIVSKQITVNPGDTLLSISEQINQTDEPSIDQVLKDFSTLNPSANPNHLEIGKNYAFPYYEGEQNK
ncbi:MAG: hypothetical protein ABF651_04520 [Sporolactobacillus sp.]